MSRPWSIVSSPLHSKRKRPNAMLTPAVLAVSSQASDVIPHAVCIVWRRKEGRWDFFCRAGSRKEATTIVIMDRVQTGFVHEDYRVNHG